MALFLPILQKSYLFVEKNRCSISPHSCAITPPTSSVLGCSALGANRPNPRLSS